ncbi:aldehyde dehydrogenase [Burkholderia stabilis]|uniref:aldehyde dehydrogenase n=1 Tax=Burkholderia stabilis TaxID=95485 RepID=UPI0009F3B797|nr:aldehyde dehydrogenase [Burkholderia stabilis]GAU06737.1 gamma-glutamyl-gamma-aminobutyraldehyde dehydrogenase [Burkholderia stabilis]
MESGARSWHEISKALQIESRAFIDGSYCEASDGATFQCISPIDGRHLADVTQCDRSEVERAVTSSRKAFHSGVWSRANPRDRKTVLLRFAALITECASELAALETVDSGKTITDTSTGDIPATAYCVGWFAEAIDKVPGEVAPTDHTHLGLITREPMGVVAAVVPWNYPLLMAAWKFAPALAAGNSVILKPSEKSPLTAIRIAGLAVEAGIPPGVFNVLPGDGRVGQLLASHADVDCIAFTGSGSVGRKITQSAANSNLKRVWTELGGKSPNIVLRDADIERAGKAAAAAIFTNMGEVCSAGSRLLVHKDVKSELLRYTLDAARSFVPGDPLDPATNIGAIVDQIQLERVLGYIEQGKSEANILLGGRRVREDTGGFYLEPTVFDCPNPRAKIVREEIFGPVLSVITFDTPEEALSIANDSIFGLAAAVWTESLATAHDISARLKAGTVWVNCYDDIFDMNFPFGGFKQSGNGRDNSLHALDKYTEMKSTIIRIN